MFANVLISGGVWASLVLAPPITDVPCTPPVEGLAWVGDGRLAVLDGAGLRLVDLESGASTTLDGAFAGGIAAATGAPRLAALGGDGVVVFDVESGERRLELALELSGEAAPSVALSTDGSKLAVLDPGVSLATVEVDDPSRVVQAPVGPDTGGRVEWNPLTDRPSPADGHRWLYAPAGGELGALRWIPADERRLELLTEPGADRSFVAALGASRPRDLAIHKEANLVACILEPAFGAPEGAGRSGLWTWSGTSNVPTAVEPGVEFLACTFTSDEMLACIERRVNQEGEAITMLTLRDPKSMIIHVAQPIENPGEGMRLYGARAEPKIALHVPEGRIEIRDARSFEILKTQELWQELGPEGTPNVRDVLTLSPDGETFALTGEGGNVYFGAAGEGWFEPISIRLPREAGRPYTARFDEDKTVLTVGCLGVVATDDPREWSYSFEEQVWHARWDPPVSDPRVEPYAFSVDESRRVQWSLGGESELVLSRVSGAIWSIPFGDGVLTALAPARDGRIAVALAGADTIRVVEPPQEVLDVGPTLPDNATESD